MKKPILVSILVLSCFVASAHASDLTLFAGYLNPGKLDLDNLEPGLKLRGNGIYGARFTVDFHRIIGLENTVEFSPKFIRSDLAPMDADVKAFLYHSNLLIGLPIGHLQPYATAGVGLITPFGQGFHPFDTRFAVNYGGGIKLLRLVGPLGFDFDVRGYSIPNVNSQTLNMIVASGGLVFTFGGD